MKSRGSRIGSPGPACAADIPLFKNEALTIDQHLDDLAKVGVFLESFGAGSYIVRCHPTWFPKGEETTIIEDIIQQVLDDRTIDIKNCAKKPQS